MKCIIYEFLVVFHYFGVISYHNWRLFVFYTNIIWIIAIILSLVLLLLILASFSIIE